MLFSNAFIQEKKNESHYILCSRILDFNFFLRRCYFKFRSHDVLNRWFQCAKTYFACAASNCMGPVASAAEAAGYVTSTNLTRSTSTERAADGERKSIKFRTRRFRDCYVVLVRVPLHVQWHSISMSSRPLVVAELYLDKFVSVLMFSFMAKTVWLAKK